jgi:MEKHLA domain
MKDSEVEPPVDSDALVAHACLLLESHQRVVGRSLLPKAGDARTQALALFEAPFVVLSHGGGVDPCFNYGNRQALRLFELDWEQLLATRSRHSAEPANQAERQRLLDAVAARGYIDDYAGVRVSRTGRRFRIVDATVWNVVDAGGQHLGQAATFARFTPLE